MRAEKRTPTPKEKRQFREMAARTYFKNAQEKSSGFSNHQVTGTKRIKTLNWENPSLDINEHNLVIT